MPVAGSYQINYTVNLTTGIGSAIAIAVNGTTVADSTVIEVQTDTGVVSGTAMQEPNAGDTLTLRNVSNDTFAMAVAPSVGAKFDIILPS